LQVNELDGECDDYIYFYYHIRDLVNPHTHYTALDKLGPIVLFVFLKTRGILLILPSFLDFFHLKYNEFTTNLKKVLNIYPDYNIRDKKFIIKKYIVTILKSFNARQRIIAQALHLFNHFYPFIQHKKEIVISHTMGSTTYATCCFTIEGVSYKVIDSSNCIWITSKGVKGTHIYNLVKNMFDKE